MNNGLQFLGGAGIVAAGAVAGAVLGNGKRRGPATGMFVAGIGGLLLGVLQPDYANAGLTAIALGAGGAVVYGGLRGEYLGEAMESVRKSRSLAAWRPR